MDLTAAGLGAAIGVLVTIGGFVARLAPQLRRIGHLVDDVMGEEPRAGLPGGRDGMIVRLTTIEGQVAEIRQQVMVNGGTSLKDIVLATRGELGALAERLADCPTACRLPTQRAHKED